MITQVYHIVPFFSAMTTWLHPKSLIGTTSFSTNENGSPVDFVNTRERRYLGRCIQWK